MSIYFSVCGKAWAKVRSMFNEDGNPMTEGKLSEAVQVIGWRELPVAGEEILEVESEKRAREVNKYRMSQEFEVKAQEQAKVAEEKHQEHLLVSFDIFQDCRRGNKRFFNYRNIKKI